MLYIHTYTHRYEANMSIYMPPVNSMQSTMSPEALVYIHFTLLG